MNSVKFLIEAKDKNNIKTDSALAEKLGVTKAAVSPYMSGKRIIENETCVALALMLGIDPIKIIMAADIDRAERAGQKSLWEVFSQRTATAASVILITILAAGTLATSSESRAANIGEMHPFRQ